MLYLCTRIAKESYYGIRNDREKYRTIDINLKSFYGQKAMGYESTERSHVAHYKVIPLTAA